MNVWIDTGRVAHAELLFGLPPLERLRRSTKSLSENDSVVLSGPKVAGLVWAGAQVIEDEAPVGTRLRLALGAASGFLVVLDGANVIDPRLIQFLARSSGACVAARGEGEQRAVALCLDASVVTWIPPEATDLRAVATALLAAGCMTALDESTFPSFIGKLRRSLPYWLYAVENAAARRSLERKLFLDNYKGSTDLLTRWVFPPLVWPLTRLCSRLHIHPNTVTVLSIVFAFAAVPLWWQGQWLAGFICAYAMSVLDSVDGKLARLTLTDSRIGNVLDHGLDIVHPPFWYFAWAWGLGARTPDDSLYLFGVALVLLYVGDRVVLGVARKRLSFTLHAATRMDERVRSIIARRNILMTVMAAALLAGAGETGLIMVTVWQGLTLAWHAARTAWLGFRPGGPVQPESVTRS